MTSTEKIQPQWFGKTLVGLMLGLSLTYGFMAIFIWFGPDNLHTALSSERLLWKTQFNMWTITPIWMLIVSFVYLFKTTKSACIYLGLANLLTYGLFVLLRGVL